MTETSSFSKLLLNFFLRWQAEQGKRASLDDFAKFLGYSRPTISMWLNGTRTPGRDTIDHLASIIGMETYDALGLPRPNPYLQKINQIFERLSPEHQRKLAEDAERYETNNVNVNVQKTPRKRKPTSNQ